MCTHHVDSILQQTSCESLSNFQWTDLIDELQKHAPTLMFMLKACTKTRYHRQNRNGVIGCCNAVEVPIQPHEPSAKVDFHHFIYRAQWKTSKLNIVIDYNTSIIVNILFM